MDIHPLNVMPLKDLLKTKTKSNENKSVGGIVKLLNTIKELNKSNELIFDNINDIKKYQIDGGSFGIVFKTKTNKPYIMKFARNDRRFSIAEEYDDVVIRKRFENVVRIYFVAKLHHRIIDEAPYYNLSRLIVMEKLDSPNKVMDFDTFSTCISYVNSAIVDIVIFNKLKSIPKNDRWTYFLEKYFKSNMDAEEIQMMEDRLNRQCFNDVLNGTYELFEVTKGSFRYWDLHDENVMYDSKTKQFKLIDIL